MKFEVTRIDFEVTLSGCCHPKILLPWQRDVTTSLYDMWLVGSGNKIMTGRKRKIMFFQCFITTLFYRFTYEGITNTRKDTKVTN